MASSIVPEGPVPQERYRAVGSPPTFALRELLRSYADLQRHIAHQLHLGLNDVAALEHLVRRDDLGPADIASLLGITTASATVLIDRLETAGHVERRPHPRDRRRKQLVVTQHAQDEMFQALQPLFDMHRGIDQHYSVDEQIIIASYLRRVSQHYEDYVHGGTDEPVGDSGVNTPPPSATDL